MIKIKEFPTFGQVLNVIKNGEIHTSVNMLPRVLFCKDAEKNSYTLLPIAFSIERYRLLKEEKAKGAEEYFSVTALIGKVNDKKESHLVGRKVVLMIYRKGVAKLKVKKHRASEKKHVVERAVNGSGI